MSRAAVAADVEAAHDRDRHAVELAEDELRRAGDLVGDGDPRRLQLVAGRIRSPERSRKTSTPAAPIATSVVACRHGRPNESVTITPTSAPVRSRSSSRSRAADASGSSGSRTSVSGSGAFDASTPAEPQTKPCRVAR